MKQISGTEFETSFQKVRETPGLVVLNPMAGEGKPDQTRSILHDLLGTDQVDYYETGEEENLRQVVQTAVRQNDYRWVAAVGGDGTVSQVADGLVGTDVPLAIIPAGTGNVIARELNIPADLKEAVRLLLERPAVRNIDGLQVGEQTYFLQIGVGLESVTMENTSSAQKNRWGLAAYVWTLLKFAAGWQPHRFTLTVDGQRHQVSASELVVANASKIGLSTLAWGEDILPDDGRIDIAVIRARTLVDYLQVLWALLRGRQEHSSHIRFFAAKDQVQLDADHDLPIHADGEILDVKMPLTAVVVPKALGVLVPPAKTADD